MERDLPAYTVAKAAVKRLRRAGRNPIIAIDGRCASGKTRLANRLAKRFRADIIRMDDFFLRPEQRSEERFARAGGNIDSERFCAEVLAFLAAGRAFSYRPYCCKNGDFSAPVRVNPRKIVIIEGSYSHLPEFCDFGLYDLKIALSVDKQTQTNRLFGREEGDLDAFFERWIPLEEKYFEAFDIFGGADILIDTSE